MKKIKYILLSLLLFTTSSWSATGDYYLPRMDSDGYFQYKLVTPTLSSLVGWTTDLNVPVSVTIGTGLNLSTSGVLTATGATLGSNTFVGTQTATAFRIPSYSNSVFYQTESSNTGLGSSGGALALYYAGTVIADMNNTYFRILGSTRPELRFQNAAWHTATITAPSAQTGTLELRISTTPMSWRVSNTWTSDTSWEAGVMDFKTTTNVLRLGTDKGSGGGSSRDVSFIRGGTEAASITSSGFVIGSGGTGMSKVLSTTSVLDFPSTANNSESTLNVTLSGAADGNVVSIGVPNSVATTGGTFFGWVSASNTITIRFSNSSGSVIDPSSGTFRVMITQF